MAVNVTNAVGANNTIVLDGSSKIPAIDGSQVTALDADVFTTGSLATARIDVGTTAGKILQLDSNAKIPAISGANLTNAPGPTQSTSDPAIDTNLTLGAKWINKTSGEVYICTDATAGANVWTNVGAGTGNINPIPPYGGSNYGFAAGGQHGVQTNAPHYYNSNRIERFSFASDGNAVDWADLAIAVKYVASATSHTYGYSCMGMRYNPGYTDHNAIQKYALTSQTNGTDIGDALGIGQGASGSSSQTHGYAAGRYVSPAPYSDQIQKYSFSTDGNATDVANLISGIQGGAGHSDWVGNYGYQSGGQPSTNVIQKYAYATDSDAIDVANLTTTKNAHNGTSSATYGYAASGNIPPNLSNIIEKFSFANGTDATDVGDLVYGFYIGGSTGQSSTTYGYTSGGDACGVPFNNWIQKYSYTSDGNASDIGNLTESKYSVTAAHY